MAYALSTHQNRLSETALVCIWNILSIDISHTKCFIAPLVLTEIITYRGDSGGRRKRDKLTNQNHGCRLPVCPTDPGQREITPID